MEKIAEVGGRVLGEASGTFDLAQLFREVPALQNILRDGTYTYTDETPDGEEFTRTARVDSLADVFAMLRNTGGAGIDNMAGLTTAIMAQLGVPGAGTANMVNVGAGVLDESGLTIADLRSAFSGVTVNIGNWSDFINNMNIFNRDEG